MFQVYNILSNDTHQISSQSVTGIIWKNILVSLYVSASTSVRYPASEFHISEHYTDNKYTKIATKKSFKFYGQTRLLSSKNHYVQHHKLQT